MIPTPSGKLVSEPIASRPNPIFRPLNLDTLYHTRSILSLRWSADGQHIYFVTNITGRYNIWRVPSTGGWPIQLTVSDELQLLQDPSPDGRYLLYTQDVGGDEKPNLCLLDLDQYTLQNITNTHKIGYRDIRWSPDGRSLAFAAEREKPGAYSIFSLDTSNGIVRKLIGNEAGECEFLHYSPDGQKLSYVRTKNYQHTGVSVLGLKTGRETVLAPIDGKSTTVTEGWTWDSRKVYVTSNANPQGTDAVALLSLEENSRFEWLTLGDWESSLLDSSPTEDRYAYLVNQAGNHRIFVRDLEGHQDEIPLPQGIVLMARFSPDGERLGMIHASADSPREIWVYHIKSQTLNQITQSLVGGLDKKNFVRPQLVIYPSYDQTPIASFLYLPPNIKPDKSHPAIIFPHGGPQWQHMNDWYPRLQYFVSREYVILAPNYRGSTGFGREFVESLRKDCGGADLRDLVTGVDYLKKTGYVDPDRVAIMGDSWGGYLTLIALTKSPDLWAAGVARVPLANWFTAHQNEDPVLQANDEWLMGNPVEDKELWHDRSPIFFADKIRAPLLLLGGRNDIRCPPSEAEQMAQAARRNNVIVDVKIYENEGHAFAKLENQIDAIKRAAEFLEANVGSARRVMQTLTTQTA